MHHRRHVLAAGLAAAAALPAPRLARAQPAAAVRQLSLVVPFPPGGGADAAARVVAEALRGTFATVCIVENRPGAAGRVGAEHVKRAPADGSVMLYTPAHPLVIFPHVYSRMPYDTLTDFVPVALTTRGVMAVAVGPAVPAAVRTLPDFVGWCRANPDKATYGAPAGSAQHFAGAMLARGAGITLTLVPYSGGAPSVADLVGGHIAATVNPLSEVTPLAGTGELRILGTTGAQRSRFLPEVPTLAESGIRDVLFQDWVGIVAPAGTPAALVNRANAVINAFLVSPRAAEAFERFGIEPDPQTPERFAAAVRADWERYREIVRSTGFRAED
ncbi:tripartite tricarboxylate transporter substrate-binding protein [Roseomonas sp. BN140053]|uniref:tripartite tricarboxylate transporter substrate-binding protein n=1 Tax=Roseomonas sp. BN140053 TaxID=3391898 RepID=UPI0039EBFD50